MPSTYPIPREKALERLLGGLVGIPVSVRRESFDDPQSETPGVYAEYVDDGERLGLVCFANHELVNGFGAALAELDASVAHEANERSVVHDECLEGFREVVNVLASGMNTDLTPHVRIQGVRAVPGEVPDAVHALRKRPAARCSYRIALDDFGVGRLILYSS